MTLFLVLAAALVLLALALVIVPLLRHADRAAPADPALAVLADRLREIDAEHAAGTLGDAEHERARLELERQALQARQDAPANEPASLRVNWGAALATAITLPLAAALLYAAVGTPEAISGRGVQAAAADPAHPPQDDAIAALSERLARDGGDAEGWVLLARSYFQLGRTQDALGAYRKATALQADNPDLWVEYANTLATTQNRDLSGEPQQLVERALRLDPNNLNALAFAGLAALQRGERETAVQHWRRLEAQLPEDSEDRARIGEWIARAQGQAPPAKVATTAPASAAPATRPEIRGTVVVDSALASQIAPADTLFVFARAENGPPMPLAAVRTRASGWPVSFTLDDSSAMAEGLALSRHPRVNIVARVSRLGNANAQPGDIEGHLEGVALGRQDVRVVLDRVVGR
ncbi:MAG TPA: c-type cytochrome biogenesis protein CcmI [Ottowia sp.]|uniref:c-type cytochrome biogenesis protein CcmI n=1 Tax=Ottowia sp. TaxID=1898956 RepID=UPI002CF1DCB4|nr:c-type cytochrome biogenesis protein CcmI [Ottowia sp.]HMN22083.1 c-type cytochrome biogenesis protein CcmI [Ottowia sp.]